MRALVVALLVPLVVAVVIVLRHGPAEGDQLLVNPGFEDGVTGWTSIDAALQPSNQPFDGAGAAVLSSAGAEQGADMFQWVAVQEVQPYEFKGFVLLNTANGQNVFLRITWFDASNSQISSDDSPWLSGAYDYYRAVSTTPRTSPPGSVLARLSIQVIASGPFEVVLDEMSFEGPPAGTPTLPVSTPTASPEASTPSPSVSATATPTQVPAPSATSTPTPSPIRTASPTTARTPTPTRIAPPATPDEPLVFPTLTNGGFEQHGANGAYGWRKIGGRSEVVRQPARSGQNALAMLSEGTSSTKWAYQTVTAQAGQFYAASAYVWHNDPGTEAAFLRLSWYDSDDGSGEAIDSVDSPVLDSRQNAYRLIMTDAAQAPPDARTAKVRLMLRPAGEGPATAFFDDASFTAVAAPTATPTAAPTTELTPTATPTEAPRTPVPSSAPTTATPALPTGTPASTQTPTPAATRAVATATPTPEPAPPEPVVFPVLTNGGFEVARDDGSPYAWRKVGGQMTATSETSAGGDLALELLSTSASTKWVFQAVNIEPGRYYEATGWSLSLSPGVETFLRVSWYSSEEGEGQALDSADSLDTVAGGGGGFTFLTTGAVRAPEDARSVRIRLMLRPGSGERQTALFDEVSLVTATTPAGVVSPTSAPAHAALGAASPPRIVNDSGRPAAVAGIPEADIGQATEPRTASMPTNVRPALQTDNASVVAATDSGGLTTSEIGLGVVILTALAGIAALLGMDPSRTAGRRNG